MVTPHTTANMAEPEFHPLNQKWVLWAHLPHDQDWSIHSYQKVYEFTSVEETIGIMETLPEGLIKNCMLFIMKEGVKPMWEDPKNINGGCFSYKVTNKFVVQAWRELTYVLTGESLSKTPNFVNCVTGITISPKKNFCIIKIWMSDCKHTNPSIVTTDVKHIVPEGCVWKKHK